MTEKNKATLIAANEAVARGDYEGFLIYCTEDTKWTFVGDKVLSGIEAVREWMTNEYIEPPINEVAHLIAEGDLVTAVGEITIKDKNGGAKRYSYSDVWRFSDGKMAELTAFVIETDIE